MATKLEMKIGTVSYHDLKQVPKSTVVEIAWRKRQQFNAMAKGHPSFKKEMLLDNKTFYIGVQLG